MDRSFVTENRASTDRLKQLASRLSEADLRHKVGPDWNVAIVFAHMAFWDRRVQLVVERSEQEGKLFPIEINVLVNDVLLPTWELMPAREAVQLAIQAAEALDKKLESLPQDLLEQIRTYNPRWVTRALHRNDHLAEAEAALKG